MFNTKNKKIFPKCKEPNYPFLLFCSPKEIEYINKEPLARLTEIPLMPGSNGLRYEQIKHLETGAINSSYFENIIKMQNRKGRILIEDNDDRLSCYKYFYKKRRIELDSDPGFIACPFNLSTEDFLNSKELHRFYIYFLGHGIQEEIVDPDTNYITLKRNEEKYNDFRRIIYKNILQKQKNL